MKRTNTPETPFVVIICMFAFIGAIWLLVQLSTLSVNTYNWFRAVNEHIKEPHIETFITNNIFYTNIVKKAAPVDKPVTAYDLRGWIITNNNSRIYYNINTNRSHIDDGIFLKEQN